MEPAIVIAIVGLLSAPLAAFITWFFNRRKYIADIYNSISESSQNAVETVQLAMNTLHIELKSAEDRTVLLVEQLNSLKKDLTLMQMTVNERDQEISSLHKRIYMLTSTIQAWTNGDTPWD